MPGDVLGNKIEGGNKKRNQIQAVELDVSVIERRDGSDRNMPTNNHRGCMYKKSHLRKVQL